MKNAIREDYNAKPERIYRRYYSKMLLHYKGTYTEDEVTWILKPRNQQDWRLEMMNCAGILII